MPSQRMYTTGGCRQPEGERSHHDGRLTLQPNKSLQAASEAFKKRQQRREEGSDDDLDVLRAD